MTYECVYRIILHHRQEGQLLTQDQEEYILIGGLALTWIGAYSGDITDCALSDHADSYRDFLEGLWQWRKRWRRRILEGRRRLGIYAQGRQGRSMG